MDLHGFEDLRIDLNRQGFLRRWKIMRAWKNYRSLRDPNDSLVKHNGTESRLNIEEIMARVETNPQIEVEAFEISTIKNSTNMELKRKIRKAKSPMEVAAYTTILLLDDFMNEKSVTDLWDETPSLVQKLKEVAEVVYDEKDKS